MTDKKEDILTIDNIGAESFARVIAIKESFARVSKMKPIRDNQQQSSQAQAVQSAKNNQKSKK